MKENLPELIFGTCDAFRTWLRGLVELMKFPGLQETRRLILIWYP
jgi:hypothetical protein